MNTNSDKGARNKRLARGGKEIGIHSCSLMAYILLLKGYSMIRFTSIAQPRQMVLFLALLLAATFGAACGGETKSSTSSSAASSSSAPGAAAFEGEITSKMSMGIDMEMRYAIKGPRSRIEMQFPAGAPQAAVLPGNITLTDMSAQTTTMLFPQTKTYTSINWGELVEEAAKAAGKDPASDFSKVTSTGKTETVAGLTCHHWMIGDKMDMCLAQGLGYFGGGQSGGILDKLKNLAQRDKIKEQLEANPEFAKFVEGGAFPLKMANVENGQSKTFMEVTKVERKSLDDALFTVPADYKKMEEPGMMGLPAGKR
ncbi:MAG TPA: DUF4412 domain-containing protein [Blastocatellia bacterium]|nr:DUF4412 domain-containing protein [Blastocatellia bacterium]